MVLSTVLLEAKKWLNAVLLIATRALQMHCSIGIQLATTYLYIMKASYLAFNGEKECRKMLDTLAIAPHLGEIVQFQVNQTYSGTYLVKAHNACWVNALGNCWNLQRGLKDCCILVVLVVQRAAGLLENKCI